MLEKPDKKQLMQIGDFAARADVSVRAIRYYEELGLLKPAGHSSGGFRLYGAEHLKRIQVINFLKESGLSLTEVRKIILAKKPSGGDKETVAYLVKALGEKLRLVEARIDRLNRTKAELTAALRILRSCEVCEHKVLLDAIQCSECTSLKPREAVPNTFEVILQ